MGSHAGEEESPDYVCVPSGTQSPARYPHRVYTEHTVIRSTR